MVGRWSLYLLPFFCSSVLYTVWIFLLNKMEPAAHIPFLALLGGGTFPFGVSAIISGWIGSKGIVVYSAHIVLIFLIVSSISGGFNVSGSILLYLLFSMLPSTYFGLYVGTRIRLKYGGFSDE